MKIIVYTANIGHYDDYNHVYVKDKNVDFIYFTDEDVQLCGWKTKLIEKPHEDNTKSARYFKCNPHLVLPEHDISVWIDARFNIKSRNIKSFVSEHFGKKDKIACYPHLRDIENGCLYIEGFVCGGASLDDEQVILKQLERYNKEGYPRKNGLFATGIIIRRNNEQVNKFNEIWWNEIQRGSKRDQISQMYAAWKADVKVKPIEGSVYGNKLVNKKYHIHKQNGSRASI